MLVPAKGRRGRLLLANRLGSEPPRRKRQRHDWSGCHRYLFFHRRPRHWHHHGIHSHPPRFVSAPTRQCPIARTDGYAPLPRALTLPAVACQGLGVAWLRIGYGAPSHHSPDRQRQSSRWHRWRRCYQRCRSQHCHSRRLRCLSRRGAAACEAPAQFQAAAALFRSRQAGFRRSSSCSQSSLVQVQRLPRSPASCATWAVLAIDPPRVAPSLYAAAQLR